MFQSSSAVISTSDLSHPRISMSPRTFSIWIVPPGSRATVRVKASPPSSDGWVSGQVMGKIQAPRARIAAAAAQPRSMVFFMRSPHPEPAAGTGRAGSFVLGPRPSEGGGSHREKLDPLIVPVDDIDDPGSVGRDPDRKIEQPAFLSVRTPRAYPAPRPVEFLDPVIARIRDVDGAGGVDQQADGSAEFAVGGSQPPPGGDPFPRRGEFLDPLRNRGRRSPPGRSPPRPGAP